MFGPSKELPSLLFFLNVPHVTTIIANMKESSGMNSALGRYVPRLLILNIVFTS